MNALCTTSTKRWLARLLPYLCMKRGRSNAAPSRWSRSRMRRVVVVGCADTPFNVGYSVHLSWLLANLGTHSAPARNSYQSAHSLPRRLPACPCTLPTPSLLLYCTVLLSCICGIIYLSTTNVVWLFSQHFQPNCIINFSLSMRIDLKESLLDRLFIF